MSDKIIMRDGDAILIMVKGGEVIHHSWNMSLPHVEFVKRTLASSPTALGLGQRRNLMARSQRSVRSISSAINFPRRLKLPKQCEEPLNKSRA